MKKDILICGVGGQGTVLASKIIAAAAMEEGNTVHSAETIGMAQRGGPVTSHVRIGEDAWSPMIPFGGADLLMAFEPGEAVRNLKYLKKDGMVITNTVPMMPVTESLRPGGYDGAAMTAFLKEHCACATVNAEEVCAPFGSTKFFNIILLGIAAGSGRLGLNGKSIRREMEKRVPEKYLEANRQAFEAGYRIGQENA